MNGTFNFFGFRIPPTHLPIEYPLRRKWDVSKFIFFLFVFPVCVVAIISMGCGLLLFPHISVKHAIGVSIWHILLLLGFLLLLWVPSLLAIAPWLEWVETILVIIRSLGLVMLILLLFPRTLAETFFINKGMWDLIQLTVAAGILFYIVIIIFNARHSPSREVRAAEAPRSRKYRERWVWFDAITLFLLFFSAIVLEGWVLLQFGNSAISLLPDEIFFHNNFFYNDLHIRMQMLSWLSCAILNGLIFFLWPCLGNRLMNAVLIPVTFHERDIWGLIRNTYRYLRHFYWAMLLKHPFLLPGGLAISLILLVIPIIFYAAKQTVILSMITQADEFVLALGVFFAWFSPLALSVVKPDTTFGEYFEQRLSNLLMAIQSHTVFFGFGSLGKRVVDREVGQFFIQDPNRKKYFMEVITPDIRLEYICTHAVVVEQDPAEVIYAGQNDLLGTFGVVSARRRLYVSKDPDGNLIRPEKRILVPVVVGNAREPFISPRINLERAKLLISMVPDEESVQMNFERAARSGINAIISIGRSDQISFYTYRARHRRIVLVYPKQNQGHTMGNRLWAAILKIRSIESVLKQGELPRVLILGNSKANHYMLETLWGYLPGSYAEKAEAIKQNVAIIVISPEQESGYPVLKDARTGEDEVFDRYWEATYVTGSSYPHPIEDADCCTGLKIKTRLINDVDTMAIEACIARHRPHIMIIDHDEMNKLRLLLPRTIRSVERLKKRLKEEFLMPMLLLCTSRGEERELQLLGDVSRYYNAMGKLYQEPLAISNSYPAHARFDHYTREIMGETIIDSLSDTEQIIVGARNSLLRHEQSLSKKSLKKKSRADQFIEICGCLPNRPGALTNYLNRLAGLSFVPPSSNIIKRLWQAHRTDSTNAIPHLPSFLYLRKITLDDAETRGFSLSGYAALVPIDESSPIFQENSGQESLVTRVFANDGNSYAEKEMDPDARYENMEEELLKNRLKAVPEPPFPGVPDVIDLLTKREGRKRNQITEFKQVLLDIGEDGTEGCYACPGMNHCRIAAFQDYIIASNENRLSRPEDSQPEDSSDRELWHARNYYCTNAVPPASASEVINPDAMHARIFCCSYGENKPGMIARVLNAFYLRFEHKRSLEPDENGKAWMINIDYFKGIVCQNPYFSLNRLFGTFTEVTSPKEKLAPLEFPVSVIRILPIGGVDSAKLWYTYARTLFEFISDNIRDNEGKSIFKFYWFNQNRNKPEMDSIPKFKAGEPKTIPILYVIKRTDLPEAKDLEQCKICGLMDAEHDCRKLRAWV